jgi:hypothetical protein
VRRALVAASLSAVALVPSAHAAPPLVTDVTGDTRIPGYDLVSARLSGVLTGRRPTLRAELRLAAGPSAPVEYDFGFVSGCDMYMFRYTWVGVAEQSDAALDHWDYCYRNETSAPDATYPVDIVVTGTTLTWTVPYVLGIHRGAKAVQPFAASCQKTWCFDAVPVTDYAESDRTYVVGSDLPRR